ncbi:MAG: hypothetical protein B7Z52_02075, partial [Burkholderiales bacterium 12-64-5]
MLAFPGVGNQGYESQCLDTGITPREGQAPVILTELIAIHPYGGLKKRANAMQYLILIEHTLSNPFSHFERMKFKLGFKRLLRAILSVTPQHISQTER